MGVVSQPMIAVVGPTASGKSHLAMAIAKSMGGEIVSCDSVQVYHGFEIGCAKPSSVDRATVPHHLLDVARWDEPFDAARYRELARAAVKDIVARGARPILCGGTGLYLRALRWGLMEVPTADEKLRAQLNAEAGRDLGALVARLRAVDPDSADSIDTRNPVRVIRALEIYELTGQPASVLRQAHGFKTEDLPMRVIVLRWPNDLLRQRIEERAQTMMREGFLEEVEGLLRIGVDPQARPMRSVGYKEAVAVVLGEAPRSGLVERVVQSTWAYARRQRTWFRGERDAEMVDIEDVEGLSQVMRSLGPNPKGGL